jgi:hypothetical protein
MSGIKGSGCETFDALPGDMNVLYKGAHVRQYVSKLRLKVSGPSGEILYFVHVQLKKNSEKTWRAFVAWRPEEGDHYDQFVNVELLRLENTPPPPRKPEPEPEEERNEDGDVTACDCGGELRFDPDLIGDTCGGLTRIGWNVCVKCGKGWLAKQGKSHEKWKLAGGGRSVETGIGRIRVDGAVDAEKLMCRIAQLPDLELEVAQLRKRIHAQAVEMTEARELFRAISTAEHAAKVSAPSATESPWREAKLIVNGIDLRDGDHILKINQPDPKENGMHTITLRRPEP